MVASCYYLWSVPPASKPTHSLIVIQQRIVAGDWVATKKAFNCASALSFDRSDIGDCVCALKASHFYKTMPSNTKPGAMQDVYKTIYCNVPIYVKVELSDTAVVISFKRDESR